MMRCASCFARSRREPARCPAPATRWLRPTARTAPRASSKQRWRRSTPASGTRRQRPMTRAVAEQGVSRFSCRSAESPSASVFLVKAEGPPLRLLRLKTWSQAGASRVPLAISSPAGAAAKSGLRKASCLCWRPAWTPRGCPSVLSEFRQGVPLLDRVRSGRLDPEEAIACLTRLRELATSAHARGLVHGSIVPGNVIVQPDSASAYLLDFGLAPLCHFR